MITADMPEGEVRERRVRDHDGLWRAGRARGIDEIASVERVNGKVEVV